MPTALRSRMPGATEAKFHRVLVTPEGTGLDVSVASYGSRAGAMMLDIMIMFGLIFAGSLALGLIAQVLSSMGVEGINSGLFEALMIAYMLFIFFLRNAYFLYFELGPRAATWGKRSVGIRVAARDGGRLTAEMIIARNLLREIELFLPIIWLFSLLADGQDNWLAGLAGTAWILVFVLFPLFNRDRLRCGDLIAGTWVIHARRADLGEMVTRADPHQDAAGQFRFSDAELAHYGEYELQTLERVLRNDQEEALVKVANAICVKIGWTPGSGYERAFLEAYYTALRAKLEREMRFGKRRADKFDGA